LGHGSPQQASLVPNLLDQATGFGTVETALFDAGYHANGVIRAPPEGGIESAVPTRTDAPRRKPGACSQVFETHFTYDATRDTYQYPAGAQLVASERCQGKTPAIPATRTPDCAACEQRLQCTTSKQGRALKRYPSEGAKETLRQAMADPVKQQCYRQRQAMVEPAFSALRLKQKLNRFRRCGLRGTRCEFALHVMASNLGRALTLKPTGAGLSACWRWFLRCSRWVLGHLTRPDQMPRSSISSPWPTPVVLKVLV